MQYSITFSLDEESASLGELFNISDVDGSKTSEKLKEIKTNGVTPGGAIKEILTDDTLSDEHKIYYLLVFGYDQGVEKVVTEMLMRI